jgi:hypothetical protein
VDEGLIYLAECQQGDVLAGFTSPAEREEWAAAHTAARDPGHVTVMWAAARWETWAEHVARKRVPRGWP